MRSWVFRNRIALERIYGSPARLRPLTELDEEAPAAPEPHRSEEGGSAADASGSGRRLVLYHLSPRPPEAQRRTG